MNIAVYCGSNPGLDPDFATLADRLGTWIGQSDNNLVYGGSSVGLMGIVSRAVLQAGGYVYGVEPQFFIDAGVAQHDLTALYTVDTMAERKQLMINLADQFVALPGGVGTLEEMAEIMSRIRLNLGPSVRCYFLNIHGFWEPLRQLLEAMVEQHFIDQCDVDRYVFCDTLEDLMNCLDEAKDEVLDPHACVPEQVG